MGSSFILERSGRVAEKDSSEGGAEAIRVSRRGWKPPQNRLRHRNRNQLRMHSPRRDMGKLTEVGIQGEHPLWASNCEGESNRGGTERSTKKSVFIGRPGTLMRE